MKFAMSGVGAGEAGANVKDSSDQDFVKDVIEVSKDTPVLVDFWAPWCGPCKTLGPVIEKVVGEKAGKVKLVKVNIDENPQIAGQLGVRSIPAVFAFDKGRPVDGFMGALPEGQIRDFVDKIMSGTDEGQQIAEALEGAEQAMATGDIGGAAQIFAAVINAEPENVRAIAGLARCYLQNGDRERAAETLEMTPADKRSDPDYKSVQTAIELMEDAPDDAEFTEAARKVEANPGDHEAKFELAEKYAAAGRHGPAVDLLLTLLAGDMNWGEGRAKEKLLTVFEAAGPKSPATIEGRRRLSSLMFA